MSNEDQEDLIMNIRWWLSQLCGVIGGYLLALALFDPDLKGVFAAFVGGMGCMIIKKETVNLDVWWLVRDQLDNKRGNGKAVKEEK